MTDPRVEALDCRHDRIEVLREVDGSGRMWSCETCFRRFYPACPTCVDVGHRNEAHEPLTPAARWLRDALEGMVTQFADWSDGIGGYTTGGLSALEDAFDMLGWDDPRPAPEARCDEPDCMKQGSHGWPTPTGGYRRTCHEHWVAGGSA